MDNSTEWNNLRFIARQIFSPAAPIDKANLFAGRRDHIQRLVNAIAERGRHAVGKTSLATIFHEIIGVKFIIPIRKQSSPEDDYSSLWREIFRGLTFEIKDESSYGKEVVTHHSLADPYKDIKITPDDVVRELRKVSSSLESTPVIIFDEFDKITDINTKKLMSHTLKALSDCGINSTIVIVGVADDINTLIDEHGSVIRNIEEIKMPRMSADELNEILDERLPQLGIEIDVQARNKIIMLSRGLPEYVHSLGRNAAIRALNDKRRIITELDVNHAIKDLLAQSEQSTNHFYKQAVHSNNSNAIYRQVLLACALCHTDDEGRFTPTNVIIPLSKILKREITIGNFQQHLAAFCSHGRGYILEKHGKSRSFKYRFREPKMQPFVIMEGIDSRVIDQNSLTAFLSKE
jgi:Cdc6-like AAA superfamily ATPase